MGSYALPMTACYAIADGHYETCYYSASYGNTLILRFKLREQALYAAYCHLKLAFRLSSGHSIQKGQLLALTGNTGNASGMQGEDQHLHFEIGTTARAGDRGSRVDPSRLYGRAPIGWTFFESHGAKLVKASEAGLRVPGVNVSVQP